MVYHAYRPNNEVAPTVSHPVNRDKPKKTAEPLVEPLYVDSTLQPIGLQNIDSGKTAVSKTDKITTDSTIPETTLAPKIEEVKEQPKDAPVIKRNTKELIDISPDNDIACFYDPVKKNLHFYPSSSEWGQVYLIYPSPDKKGVLRRNLIYPDYEGLIHPLYRKGNVSYNGNSKEAVSVKINNKASRNRGYIIQAKNDPEYFIFGDYENKKRWYIYENGKVRKFSPPEGFDAGIVDKL